MFKVLLIEAMKELKTPIARRMITKAKTPVQRRRIGRTEISSVQLRTVLPATARAPGVAEGTHAIPAASDDVVGDDHHKQPGTYLQHEEGVGGEELIGQDHQLVLQLGHAQQPQQTKQAQDSKETG